MLNLLDDKKKLIVITAGITILAMSVIFMLFSLSDNNSDSITARSVAIDQLLPEKEKPVEEKFDTDDALIIPLSEKIQSEETKINNIQNTKPDADIISRRIPFFADVELGQYNIDLVNKNLVLKSSNLIIQTNNLDFDFNPKSEIDITDFNGKLAWKDSKLSLVGTLDKISGGELKVDTKPSEVITIIIAKGSIRVEDLFIPRFEFTATGVISIDDSINVKVTADLLELESYRGDIEITVDNSRNKGKFNGNIEGISSSKRNLNLIIS